MPLTTLSHLLKPAQENRYAVAAFDVFNAEYAAAITRVAEEEKAPLILMVYEGYLRYSAMDLLVPALIEIAKRSAVPVAIHLDHATQWETVVHAVKAGCTSVMLDCSTWAYDPHVARMREVVSLCRPLHVSVESELGTVLGDEAIGQPTLVRSEADEGLFTDVDEARRYVQDTGVDALAVSVGTTHGLYRCAPRLDLERIQAIATQTGVPLVLHGGTGLSDQDFCNAIEMGIAKVNVNTSLVMAAGKRLKALFDEKPGGVQLSRATPGGTPSRGRRRPPLHAGVW